MGRQENAVDFFIDRHVRDGHDKRVAFVDPWRQLSYGDLQGETARFAGGLQALGIASEHRIALLLRDSVAFPIAFWGAIRAGVTPVPVNTLLPPEQTEYILTDSRAEAVVIDRTLLSALTPVLDRLPRLRHVIIVNTNGAADGAGSFDRGVTLDDFLTLAPPATEPAPASADEVAFWLYSSGSTAAPKGVKHVHGSLRHTAETYGRQILQIAPDDLVYSVAKLFFAYGLGNAMTFPMSVGASSVLLPDRATPEAVMELMRRHHPTVFCGVPTFYAAMLQHPKIAQGAGSARLRCCISAGEALPEAIGNAWRRTVGVDILDGIGSTEMLHIFISNRVDALRYGTSGVPVPGYEVKIVDEHGAPVPDGEIGELIVKGASAAEGYWNQRARTRRTFAGEWTWTGDKYYRDGDGFYHCCGRSDDMFKVSGIWVSPFEVEAALSTHPAVLEAAVIGRAGNDGLVKPHAFVVLKRGHMAAPTLLEELRVHVKEQAGPWKYPRWIDVIDELPKTATGKIQRFRLRRRDHES